MDYSLVRKNPLVDAVTQQKTNKPLTPNSSIPKPTPFAHSPSPDRPHTNIKPRQAELNRLNPNNPSASSPYTPLGISRSRLISAKTIEEVDQLVVEHRYEVQTLLLEIGRLQEQLHQAHEHKQLEVRRARQQFEEDYFLQVSQVRQNQNQQAEVFELQIRKLKEQVADRGSQIQRITNLLQRQKESHQREKSLFQEQVRILIQKKNSEIYELSKNSQDKLNDYQLEKTNQIEELRYNTDKEINKLNKQLQQHQDELEKLKNFSQGQNKQKQRIITYLENQRDSIERRYEQRLDEQSKKYDNIRNKFNQLINQYTEQGESNRNTLKSIFESEYSQLMNLVKVLEADNNEIRKQLEMSIIATNIERQSFKEENSSLKAKINELIQNNSTDMEILKVKLAVLHKNDLKALKDLYELRLKNATSNFSQVNQQASKLREYINVLSHEKYQAKKKYQNTISHLHARIMKMRLGMSSMENQFKEKLDNQKSVMLMTSRSFIKEAEAKDTNNKFLEEEIRKLRQLMDLQGRENENAERAIEQKVLVANNQLERLSQRVLVIAKEKKELEETLQNLRDEKNAEIQKLRNQLIPQDVDSKGNVLPQFKIIDQLKTELSAKKEEIGILQDKVAASQSRFKQMQADIQRLTMQNNMNTEELKKQFHGVAEKHLQQFKKYYQQKLKRTDEEKAEMKKIISSQKEQITDLIKKYRQIEEDLKEAVKLMKKRTVLEDKVMNIGMDINLTKNMTDLLPHFDI